MIQFNYKNNEYFINNKAIGTLIGRKDLLELPMEAWKELLAQLNGMCTGRLMYTVLKAKIEAYDTSDEVNSFLIGDTKYWLDKNTRVGLMHLANCSTDNLQLVLNGNILTIPVDVAKNFLAQLEVYAGQCYLQTQKHLLAVKELKSIEDIINYDYTSGYPEKIQLNLDLI